MVQDCRGKLNRSRVPFFVRIELKFIHFMNFIRTELSSAWISKAQLWSQLIWLQKEMLSAHLDEDDRAALTDVDLCSMQSLTWTQTAYLTRIINIHPANVSDGCSLPTVDHASNQVFWLTCAFSLKCFEKVANIDEVNTHFSGTVCRIYPWWEKQISSG